MKHLLSFLPILIVSGISAQPSFNFSDVTPRAGDVYLMVMSDVHPSPGNEGANQIWDLTGMTRQATVINSITPVDMGPHAANVPGAVLQSYDGNNYAFFSTAESKYMTAGYVANGVVMNYTDEEELMQFPMTYNKHFNDKWASTYIAGSYEINRTATSAVSYDGYGTLKTPAGTFNNVARIRTEQVVADASQFGLTTTTVVSYAWWVIGEHYPLAQIATAKTRNKESSYSWYRTMGVNTVGLAENGKEVTSLISYPNPASDVLYVNAVRDKALVLEFCDSQGKILYTETVPGGNAPVKLNVAGYDRGIYFVRLRTENKSEMKKVVLDH